MLGCERLVAKWQHLSLENKDDLIKKNYAISCSGMGLELDLLYYGLGRRWKEFMMCRGIGVVYLDLIREVCFVLCLTGTHCYTVSLTRTAQLTSPQ